MPVAHQRPWVSAAALAELHSFRTQHELDECLSAGIEQLLPGLDFAVCLAAEGDSTLKVAFVGGAGGCPFLPGQRVGYDSWALAPEQRLPITFRDHVLGVLFLGGVPEDNARAVLEQALVHYGTALVNLTLNLESRQATENYCASLQALEEGIVLFQEEDPAAVMARLLSLASGMVQAAAGALFVLNEVGKVESGLRLEQVLGMPESLLGQFRGCDGNVWPDVLLEQPAHLARRDDAAPMAMLAADCVPPILQSLVVLPLRYHGVQAGLCLLFNPVLEEANARDHLSRLQSFGQLAAALLHRLQLEALTANSQSIARELQIAETIQKRLLPSRSPATDEYEFAWVSIAAKNIGGDYLDLLPSDLGDLYGIVADASGHGINSALLMSSFRANYRSNAPWSEPNEVAARLNDEVCNEVGPTGMFITSAFVRLERETKQLTICSAGHNPLYLLRAGSGAVETIESHGPPLGFVTGVEYGSFATRLESGDVLLLYTDGITEAGNVDGEMFGDERLVSVLMEHGRGDVGTLLEVVRAELARFAGRDRYDDDVTLMLIKVR